jgi:hypothetical protein
MWNRGATGQTTAAHARGINLVSPGAAHRLTASGSRFEAMRARAGVQWAFLCKRQHWRAAPRHCCRTACKVLAFLDCVDWRLAADKAGLGSVQYGRTVPVIFGFRL